MTPLHHEPNPRVIFERLFGDGGSAAEHLARMKRDASILDSVSREIVLLNKKLGNRDKAILDEYLVAIRDIERRIQISEKQGIATAEALPDELPDFLRGREHLHAWHFVTRVQSQLLQIY